MNNRNKPCQCGSGKKTKKCCGNEAEKTRKYHIAEEKFKQKLSERKAQNQTNTKGMPLMAALLMATAFNYKPMPLPPIQQRTKI